MGGFTAVILCGGGGRRLGGVDKGALEVGGRRLVDRVVEAVRRAGATDVVLAGRSDPYPDLPGVPDLPITAVPDPVPDAGPVAGLVAGLEAADHPVVFACAVDHPHLDPPTVARVVELLGDAEAAVPVVGGSPQSLHAAYARDALPALRTALEGGVRALHEALGRLDVREVKAEELAGAGEGWRRSFRDVDEPSDLEELG